GRGSATWRHPGARAAAHRRADPGLPRPARRDRAGHPGRVRRVAALARPRRHHHGRPVRGLPAAHPGGRGAPAAPRRPARPAGDRRTGRTAPAAARPAPPPRVQRLRRLARGSDMTPLRVLLPACLLLLLAACQREAEVPPPAPAPEPAQAAPARDTPKDEPALRVRTLDGATYDLAAHRGKWVVVNYWATWCRPCLEEMPELSALDAMREHVEVVGLAYEEIEPEALRAFLEKR